MATVEIIQGADSGSRVELVGKETEIGRHLKCTVVLRSRSVSRHHARIVSEGDEFVLEDLNSCNGTYVNGERVTNARPLDDGDHIQIEEHVLLFHGDRPSRSRSDSSFGQTSTFELRMPGGRPQRATTILKKLDVRTDPRLETNSYEKLRAVLQTARNLGSSLDVDEILPKVLDSLFKIFPRTSLAYALLGEGPDKELMLRAYKERDHDDDEPFTLSPMNRDMAKMVMSEGKAILSSDADTDTSPREQVRDSVFDSQILSSMCAPMIGPSGEPQGIIHVETDEVGDRFDEDDLELLMSLATVAGQAVEYARIHEAQIELHRQERELETARDVQLHFLPQRTPTLPGYQFYQYYQAAHGVGGDYYGYVELPDSRLAVAMGDVAGKGISAALLMARLCAEVRFSLVTAGTAAEAVDRLNRELRESVPELRFVTFVLCILDPKAHEATIVNAGHLPPLLRRHRSNTVEPIGVDTSGPPLGVRSDHRLGQTTVSIEPGDMLLLYTDGVSEAMNQPKELFGIHRVEAVLQNGPSDVSQMGQALLDELNQFTAGEVQHDDACLVCISRDL